MKIPIGTTDIRGQGFVSICHNLSTGRIEVTTGLALREYRNAAAALRRFQVQTYRMAAKAVKERMESRPEYVPTMQERYDELIKKQGVKNDLR